MREADVRTHRTRTSTRGMRAHRKAHIKGDEVGINRSAGAVFCKRKQATKASAAQHGTASNHPTHPPPNTASPKLMCQRSGVRARPPSSCARFPVPTRRRPMKYPRAPAASLEAAAPPVAASLSVYPRLHSSHASKSDSQYHALSINDHNKPYSKNRGTRT